MSVLALSPVTGRKILAVDDDPDILKLLEMRLVAAGYQVVTAANGEEALAHIGVSRPALVISDLRMPRMDGLALFDAIHQADPALPVILLTAHGSIPEAVDATRRGVFGFLTKPFDSKSLLQQVEAALRLTAGAHVTADSTEDQSWREAIITRSPHMENLLSQAKLMAMSDASVFIQGDSGTGKELLARAIHKASPRNRRPFVAINCGAIPEALLESELFGHTKGAFTGAVRDNKGLFQSAEGGTIFLDEIGDMPMPLQVKLLRALQERVIRPVGSNTSIAVDVRIISATHKNLAEEMKAGRFREDLYYRINVVSLDIPSLAGRREDIPLLANNFLHALSTKYGKNLNGFSPDAMELLIAAPWPGNVRQLQNIVEQTVVLSTTPLVSTSLVQKALQDDIGGIVPFEIARKNFERDYLIKLLKATNGGVTQAARLAQRNRTEFYKLLQRHQLTPALFKDDTSGQAA
ncbi:MULTISPECIES: sigma 54-interacting transcriptional regulator [Methylovorus]|jgi:two-component system, NtrC family, response regulator GlrR|uniref:Putative two component, sigma54 specific, transcriptional regulator, Fis family n=1 Tax=Methylovorus glucosotrophus (strain SIP3-4) TaxID=582744 RepID=C6XC55_METGS|nr:MULTISPECIES: sigma 54-interacting transcriptional regulator [Methylovorus]ACT50130.1 putative two component, sigma54 specific, transcriptional regulator, Fis family [Methylovorus glucosotrophus SIP3-4]ADQ84088.1 putative two component, sigma54 specific, transcriptional regulator, Fis family [Methylovorus sp. MP688]KAF0844533.1 two-component system response regulator GlrR [Methylovorus glucosotrophus]